MAGNRNSGMCSPLCSDVCAFYLPPRSFTIHIKVVFYVLYKLAVLLEPMIFSLCRITFPC